MACVQQWQHNVSFGYRLGCNKARPDSAHAILSAMAAKGSRWRQAPLCVAFIEYVRKPASGPFAKRRTFEAVALATMTEQRRNLDLRNDLSALLPDLLFSIPFSKDSGMSTFGMCGRSTAFHPTGDTRTRVSTCH